LQAAITERLLAVDSTHPSSGSRPRNSPAFSSAGITSVGVNNAHLPSDTVEWISPAKLDEVVFLIAHIVESLQDRSPAWRRESQE